ncbi:hypothetical protein F5148DRAFT_787961 [Russula earlei]|uniref:Uncharacterized protein n=1 Tax=Russula earlei TaxID=71964 RepID=A0ACC0UDU1_9AGAM|nr:hypothetical protein F5148DRAFT_787961 [Russula earlei]
MKLAVFPDVTSRYVGEESSIEVIGLSENIFLVTWRADASTSSHGSTYQKKTIRREEHSLDKPVVSRTHADILMSRTMLSQLCRHAIVHRPRIKHRAPHPFSPNRRFGPSFLVRQSASAWPTDLGRSRCCERCDCAGMSEASARCTYPGFYCKRTGQSWGVSLTAHLQFVHKYDGETYAVKSALPEAAQEPSRLSLVLQTAPLCLTKVPIRSPIHLRFHPCSKI